MFTASISDSIQELTTINGIGLITDSSQHSVVKVWSTVLVSSSRSMFESICVCISFCIRERQTRGVHAHAAGSTDVHRAGTHMLNSIQLGWSDYYKMKQAGS